MVDEKSDQKPVLNCCNLELTYDNKKAFSEITFGLQKNEVTAIIGPSGCGKSSLLMSLNDLIHENLSAKLVGEVTFNEAAENRNINSRNAIGLIFQKPNPFPLSIRKNLEIPLKEHFKLNRKDMDLRIQDILKDVGLWGEVKGRLNEPALSLSGGQQQRLCIARALVLEPTILLMDEPCSSLDPIATETIEKLILRLKERCSVLIVTHNLAQAQRISDQTIFFWYKDDTGYIEEKGSTEDMFSKPQSQITSDYIMGRKG